MVISEKQYALGLYQALDGKTDIEIKELIHNFIAILYKANVLNKQKEIIREFKKIWDEEKGEINAELWSARPLSEKTKELVLNYLKEKLSVQEEKSSLKINLQEKIKEDLRGGFILNYNSLVLDASLENNLKKLKNKISN